MVLQTEGVCLPTRQVHTVALVGQHLEVGLVEVCLAIRQDRTVGSVVLEVEAGEELPTALVQGAFTIS